MTLESLQIDEALTPDADFRDVSAELEYFVTAVLSEVHREWKSESLDGVLRDVVRKTAPHELEIIGLCILVHDQTLTHIHLRIEINPESDEVVWMERKLGETDSSGRLIRWPYGIHQANRRPVIDRLDSINWTYFVEFGERSQSIVHDEG